MGMNKWGAFGGQGVSSQLDMGLPASGGEGGREKKGQSGMFTSGRAILGSDTWSGSLALK